MQLGSLPRLLLVATAFALPHATIAQAAKPLSLHVAIQDKNFLLFSYLQADPQVRNALVADKELSQISAER